MPRFRLSNIKQNEEPDYPVRIITHKSGRQSVVRSDIATIQVFNADGTEDPHSEYHDVGGVKLKEFQEMIEKPSQIDLKKLKQEGRIVKERRLLPK